MKPMDIDPGKLRWELLGLALHVLSRFRVTFHYSRDYHGATDTDEQMKVSQVGSMSVTFHESLPVTHYFIAMSCSSSGYSVNIHLYILH